jgi:hypothetical protein
LAKIAVAIFRVVLASGEQPVVQEKRCRKSFDGHMFRKSVKKWRVTVIAKAFFATSFCNHPSLLAHL